MHRVGIVGASGYVGAELLRLCAAHPGFELAWATAGAHAGAAVADLHPHLAAALPELVLAGYQPELVEGIDLVFFALPHGTSSTLVPEVRDRGPVVVDLAADFRLADPALYPRWYGEEHPAPDLLGQFACGLPELFRSELAGATAVAVPGCYPTAAALALAPLLRAGVIEPAGVVVDAASGVSGAGRAPKATTTFCAVDEDFRAYGLLDHRHTPEIEQATGAQVLFTPHLAPMTRGILATCYARPAATTSTGELLDLLAGAYGGERFVVVTEGPPSTRATAGSNCAHLTARHDHRTGWVLVLCALDNLVKGAAGQAVQCANVALGVDEGAGLPVAGLAP
ncbi:MAG: N-acetyl-gamma-glutamyl-phosphate reductase [Acidimicrobiales bacterium]